MLSAGPLYSTVASGLSTQESAGFRITCEGRGEGSTFSVCLCLLFSNVELASREPFKHFSLALKGQEMTLLMGARECQESHASYQGRRTVKKKAFTSLTS